MGGSMGPEWLLSILQCLRHAGKTRLAHPGTAACWLTTGPVLQDSAWPDCQTTPNICHSSFGILRQLIHWLLDNSMLGLAIISTRLFPLAVVHWNNLSACNATPDKPWKLQTCYLSGVPLQTINANTTVFIFTFSCLYCLRGYIFQKLLLPWILSCTNKNCFFIKGTDTFGHIVVWTIYTSHTDHFMPQHTAFEAI